MRRDAARICGHIRLALAQGLPVSWRCAGQHSSLVPLSPSCKRMPARIVASHDRRAAGRPVTGAGCLGADHSPGTPRAQFHHAPSLPVQCKAASLYSAASALLLSSSSSTFKLHPKTLSEHCDPAGDQVDLVERGLKTVSESIDHS